MGCDSNPRGNQYHRAYIQYWDYSVKHDVPHCYNSYNNDGQWHQTHVFKECVWYLGGGGYSVSLVSAL